MEVPSLLDVAAAATELTLGHSVSDDRIVFPWPDHRSIAYFGHESATHLVMLSVMRKRLEFSQINEAARLITMWNEKRIGPTALLEITDDAAVIVKFRSALPIEAGVTEAQLQAFLTTASETAVLAVQYFLAAFPDLTFSGSDAELVLQDEQAYSEHLPGTQIPGKPSEPPTIPDDLPDEQQPIEDPMDAEDETPTEVTLERVREALRSLGTPRNDLSNERLITAFNDVIYTFFIDNGPTLLVRGYWRPSLDPKKDFMRLFLLCNEWNESAATTKAFCHTDSDGLQVHVEYTVPVSLGLSDTQLVHAVAVSVQTILNAIDRISTNATGTSAVQWPE